MDKRHREYHQQNDSRTHEGQGEMAARAAERKGGVSDEDLLSPGAGSAESLEEERQDAA